MRVSVPSMMPVMTCISIEWPRRYPNPPDGIGVSVQPIKIFYRTIHIRSIIIPKVKLKWYKSLWMVIMILILPGIMIVILWIIVPISINIIARIIIWILILILHQVLMRHPMNMMPVCVPPTIVMYPSRIRIFVLTFLNGIVNHGMIVMVVVSVFLL